VRSRAKPALMHDDSGIMHMHSRKNHHGGMLTPSSNESLSCGGPSARPLAVFRPSYKVRFRAAGVVVRPDPRDQRWVADAHVVCGARCRAVWMLYRRSAPDQRSPSHLWRGPKEASHAHCRASR